MSKEKCTACKGTGREDVIFQGKKVRDVCSACNGLGFVDSDKRDFQLIEGSKTVDK